MKKMRVVGMMLAMVLTSCDYFLPGNFELVSYADYSSDYEGDGLVLNGYVTDGHGVYAEVRHSLAPERKMESDSVGDAVVLLLRGGEVVDTLERNARRRLTGTILSRYGYYLTAERAGIEGGGRYALRAVSGRYGVAESAEVEVPGRVGVDSVWALRSYDGRYSGYGAMVRGGDVVVVPLSVGYRYGLAHSEAFPGYWQMVDMSGRGAMSVDVDKYYAPYGVDSVEVGVLALSGVTVGYLRSVEAHKESGDDLAYEYPLAVEGNVSGGYGFVGSYAVSSMTIVGDSVNRVVDWEWEACRDSLDVLDVYLPMYE